MNAWVASGTLYALGGLLYVGTWAWLYSRMDVGRRRAVDELLLWDLKIAMVALWPLFAIMMLVILATTRKR